MKEEQVSEQQDVEETEAEGAEAGPGYAGRPAGRHVCVPDEEHCNHVEAGPPPLALEE